MRKVIRINTETGLFIEDVILQNTDITPGDCIETPCPDGFHHPKWDFEAKEWLEGAAVDMSALKDQKLAALNGATVKALSRFQFNGMTLEISAEVMTNIADFRLLGPMTPDRSIIWRALDGTFKPGDPYSFVVTLEERLDLPGSVTIDQLHFALVMYKQTVYDRKDVVIAEINAAETPEELGAIVVDYVG